MQLFNRKVKLLLNESLQSLHILKFTTKFANTDFMLVVRFKAKIFVDSQ